MSRVAAVYAGIAYVIFEIVDATFEPLRLPDWASTLVIVIQALGQRREPTSIITSWQLDVIRLSRAWQ